MSELQESIIRGQVIILLDRNQDKAKRIMERFLKCIKGEFNEAKKIINET
jgi:GGDEF domain-containing protein